MAGDEVARTIAAYRADADAFVEKYRDVSVADRYGDAFLDGLPGDRLLDVGCGPGVDAATFADAGYDVTGVDLTADLLRAAREDVSHAGFVRGDMRRLPIASGAVDGVWCCAALLHLPRAEAPGTLAEFGRVLVDGGALFLSVMAGDDGGYHEDGRYFEHYRPEGLRSLLGEAGFEVDSLTADEDWIRVVARR